MKNFIFLLVLIISPYGFAQQSLELNGSFSPISGSIKIGPSSADIEMNKLSANFKFSEKFSASISRFWNDSTVEIYNLSLNYEYIYQINPIFSLEPNAGLGVGYYTDSTPIQPTISSPGLTFNTELKVGIKIHEKIKIVPGFYYHFMSFSQGVCTNKRDNDIIVDQMGLQLGVK